MESDGRHSINAEAGAYSITGSDVALVVTRYHQQLLELAQELIDEEKRHRYSLAVIVAHMACEMAVEQVVSKFTKGIKSHQKTKRWLLWRLLSKFRIFQNKKKDTMYGYNIGSKRNRRVYTKLTGDKIQQQPFWQKFKNSADRRNDVVHDRHIATKEEAQESIKSVKVVIKHLKDAHNMPWD